MNLLLDASLPPRFARSLNLLFQPDITCSHVRDILGNDASDRHVADHLQQHEQAIFLALDLDITGQPHRLEVLRGLKRPVFLLSSAWASSSPEDQAWMLTYWVPRIAQKAAALRGPSICVVPAEARGRIRKLS